MIAGPARQTGSAPGDTGMSNAPGSGAERNLADMLARVLRNPAGRVALALHLSRLPPPAPYPHHLRVAHALMQDCAQRFNGQAFILPTQDIVLVATLPQEPSAAEHATSPLQLRETLSRLFAAEAPQGETLTSFWRLDGNPRPFSAFVAGAAAAPPRVTQPSTEIPASPRCLAALEESVARSPIAEAVIQTTGLALGSDRKLPLNQRLKPAYRELRVALRLLNLQPPATEALADPYLRAHFGAQLDQLFMQALQDDLRLQGPITLGARDGALPIHVSLGLEAITGSGFTRLARQARESRVQLAIQVSPMQAVLGIDLLDQARKLFGRAECSLMIGPVDVATLGAAAPDKLTPQAIGLVWSQTLADLVAGGSNAVARNFARMPPEAIILQEVDSEQAVAWGQNQGITRYQGRYLDLVQAATRMGGCYAAANCTVRQCSDRASSLSNAGRAGCLNRPLLDVASLKTA